MTTAPRLTVDLSALAQNWQSLREKSGQAETSAVIKADAYGLGIEYVAPVLSDAGCRTFFVAMVEEGVRVRNLLPQARIFVLNGVFADTIATATEHRLSPVLSSLDQIHMWIAAARGRSCAIHVDTGMNRLGLTMKEAKKLAGNASVLQSTGAQLLMSHLACADEPDHPMNAEQSSRFTEIAGHFPGLEKSLANSAAVLSNPGIQFDLTRPGIAVFGGEAVNGVANAMRSVVLSETRILQIRQAEKGEVIGYGATQVLQRNSRIAICSSGYADGFHRAASGSGVPLRNTTAPAGFGAIGDHLVPVIGRVSMDLTAFDVTDVPAPVLERTGWIELFGRKITLDDAARSCGTIGYELLTGLGRRYQRHYQEQ